MRHKILVIDDEKIIRTILQKSLTEKYDVETKEDGSAALKWLEENLPDLVICDIQMQPMDGYGFLKEFRKGIYTRETPVIMLSGEESSKERVKCYGLDAQDFLVKPFNPEELHALIQKNLYPVHYNIDWSK